MLVHEGFQQTPLALPLPWSSDEPLQRLLERLLPAPLFRHELVPEIEKFEQRIAGPIRELAAIADTLPASIEPVLIQYDQFGRRVDKLHTSESWRKLKGIAAEEGLVAIPFERKEGEFARLHVGCPISMTDGCARVLELAGTEELKQHTDPDKAYTAGQWMTERPGGSDVSLTETVARPVDPGHIAPGDAFVLDGFKWFSSATDGDVALALARTGGKGSKGLSLFLVKLRDDEGKTNGIHVHRMKKKFGTRALPTAELSISGAVGHLVGPLGAGVKTITSVLNITRLYSAISCTSSLRRGLLLAKSFASVRHIAGNFDSLLRDNAMHTSALAQSELTHRAVLQLTFSTALLLGRSEALAPEQFAESDKWRLRLLTPVAKAFAAELTTSELPRLMEALGGQGYMQENEFGRLIADSNVERIWEGTTSVLALDVVRVIAPSKGAAVKHFSSWARCVLSSARNLTSLSPALSILTARLDLLSRATQRLSPGAQPPPHLPRALLFHLGYLASSLHLLEQAAWSAHGGRSEAELDAWVVQRWVDDGRAAETERELERVLRACDDERSKRCEMEKAMVYGAEKPKSKL
ncbi:hypothetical protein Rhopal_003345-T1 [Rhodotorula paludigena]|uniref:Acyl-CoA dehydrogenase n=1 Tax=Rhodotorula paludigena TaxID=86838 RepID=A0AAV5GCW9_9BASI|nr:hypothetical protein Rhopal_003345-T1 [Rhodotorula paludigena]